MHWKDWCWSWNSNTLATWFEDLTQWKRPWCWERLKVGGEGDDRGWHHSWVASQTQWTWVWVNSGSWWWTGRPGVLWFMGSKRVGHDWVTKLTDWLKLPVCGTEKQEYALEYIIVKKKNPKHKKYTLENLVSAPPPPPPCPCRHPRPQLNSDSS